MKQGTKVCLEGRIQTNSYTKQDGSKAYSTDVVVENVEFAESKNASSNSGYQAPPQQPQAAPAPAPVEPAPAHVVEAAPAPAEEAAPAETAEAPAAEAPAAEAAEAPAAE